MQREIKVDRRTAKRLTKHATDALDVTEGLATRGASDTIATLRQAVDFIKKHSGKTALAMKVAHKFIRKSPYAALGIGLGIGFLVGFTMKDDQGD
jgi:ElaB/YqjD/DUF883 family membrane-anchored ribosome-binding protein